MHKTILFIVFVLVNVLVFGQSLASYTFTITTTWNDNDHGPLPSNAHWSDLVGTLHNNNVAFWQPNTLASVGIEDVAEEGRNRNFNNEVLTAITNNNASEWLQVAFTPFNAISTATLNNIQVSSDFPLVTLASMIAPSPDWFIGVHDVSLMDANGDWINNITIDLFVYDAGTEEGTAYDTENIASMPHVNISPLVNVAPFNNEPVATLSIILNSVLSIDETKPTTIKIYPNPAIGNNLTIENANHIDLVEIYDTLGKMVLKSDFVNDLNSSKTVNIAPLKNGVYIIRISNKDQTTNKRLVVNRN